MDPLIFSVLVAKSWLPVRLGTWGHNASQFRKNATCPEDGVFAGKTYCDTILGS